MATLKFHPAIYRTNLYFILKYKGLIIYLDKFNAVNFEHDFKDIKQRVTLKHIYTDDKGSIGTQGGVFYQPGHADHFYFSLNGIASKQSVLTPELFKPRDTLLINLPKYQRIQDAVSGLIIENYSLLKHKKNVYFFQKNKQTFETEGEFYWAMKYLLLKSHRKLDKVFPTGLIFMKSIY